MRVLFTSTPTYGHFHPLVPLARALLAAGHEVRVACPAAFRSAVDGAGLPFIAAGSADIPPALMAELAAVRSDPLRRAQLMITRVFFGLQAQAMVPDLLAIIDDWAPDMMVRDYLEYGGLIAAELRDLPHAASGAVAFQPPPVYAAVLDGLSALRSAFGLPLDPDGASLFRDLVLAPLPQSWVPPDAIVPPTMHFVRPEPFNASGVERLPAAVTALPPARPTVHASLGTINNDVPGVYEAILAGLREEDLNLVLTCGREGDPDDFGPQPPNVIIARYIPHSALLPRCDVMLTHCGLNSIMACLELGLPMVGIPITADQPRNAERLAALGVAVIVGPGERTPEAFRTATQAVLTDPSYRRNAEQLRDEIAGMPGSDRGVALLEQLVKEHQPVVAAEA